MKIRLKKLSPDIKLPTYAHPGDAGLDLFSQESFTLQPGERHLFPLGFSIELDFGYVGLVKDKSGLALKYGLHVLAGVIDPNYRGEYAIVLANLGEDPYNIEKGDKIAQLLIVPIATADIEVSAELDATERGVGAFGSTGK